MTVMNVRHSPSPTSAIHFPLQVIPIHDDGKLLEAYNIRLEEQCVVDLKFLHTPPAGRPTLAVLFEDTRKARHVKTYEVGLRDKVGSPSVAECPRKLLTLAYCAAWNAPGSGVTN